MPTTQKTQKIAAAFQRYSKSGNLEDVASFSLEELRRADYDLEWRDQNSGFRLAMEDRISKLESDRERRRQSWIRTLGYFVALLIAGITYYATLR